MLRTRAFFYVCAGIFLLALAYHLGARSAGAQAGNQIGAGCYYSYTEYAAASDGRIYARGTQSPSSPWSLFRTLPTTSPVVGLAVTSNQTFTNILCYVFCADGTVWDCEGASGPCQSTSVFSGSPVPAQSISIGGLKAKYATPAPVTK